MATIRETLNLFGGAENIIADAPEFFDVEIESARWMASCADGGLRFVCGGGEEIVSFRPKSKTRRDLCLIREDNDGHVWENEHRERAAQGIDGISRPRPSPKLRLVQTA